MTKPAEPRDADATRRRILDAATIEFAAFGLAGARTARIAEAARSNPRMLYAYYGSKNALFTAVLNHHAAAHTTIPFDAEDLPRYAQHLFDHYRGAPHLARLLLWQSLERPDLTNASPTLRAATEHRIAAIEYAQSTGHVTLAVPAASLLDQIHTLARADATDSTLSSRRTADQRHELALAVAALIDPRRVAVTTA